MNELRKIIGDNLANLRKNKKITQLELAERFGYSDKAISKWENGDMLPDVETLYQLCNFYGISLDYLCDENNINKKPLSVSLNKKLSLFNRICITALVASFVWILATIIFVYLLILSNINYWQIFVWAIPLTTLIILFMNRIYFKNKFLAFTLFSLMVWSIIAGCYIQFVSYNIWPLFLVGVPIQLALILWLGINPKNRY
ncbi:MAG: helix-turn-helix domain-containing protein [Bacilli bacterium]